MDLLNEEEIGAVLYSEIIKRRKPLSAAEFARKEGVREEIVHKLLRNLCDINVAAIVDGNKYISVELAPGEPTHTFRESPIPTQPKMEGECLCPNRGPGCVHYTSIQNNTHNHYNMQVGDNNTIYMDSAPGEPTHTFRESPIPTQPKMEDGPRRSDA